jgi:hypothetical protein
MLTTAMDQLNQLSQAEEASVDVANIVESMDFTMPAVPSAAAVSTFELPAASPGVDEAEEWSFASAPEQGESMPPVIQEPSPEVAQSTPDSTAETPIAAQAQGQTLTAATEATAPAPKSNEALLDDLM